MKATEVGSFETEIKAKAWKNGCGSYGIQISKKDRDARFKRNWASVSLTLPNSEIVLANIDKDSFWKSCPEIIAVKIKSWLEAEGLLEWPRQKPPELILRQSGDAAFVVFIPKDDPRTQAEKFEDAARELGCDEDEDRLKGVLRKLAKPKS